MTVKFEKLAESLGLDEETREQVTEAWNTKLKEARQEIAAELREEFAQKFEHDKTTLIKSMDRFLTEKVSAEVNEFAQDKREAAAERVRYKKQVQEHLKMLDGFLKEAMAREVQELRADRKNSTSKVGALEKFVLKQLSEEVRELRKDKQALVEQRVRLVRETKSKLNESRRTFVKKSAAIVEENLNKIIQKEIGQYRDDIEAARRNDFGRRIFEAFASEYMGSHLNESSEVKKVLGQMSQLKSQLEEAQAQLTEKSQLLESANVKIRAAQDMVGREKTLNNLMAPLSRAQKKIMGELLENVKTSKLQESFDKYLPAVLNESAPQQKKSHTHKRPLREGAGRKEVTGNRRLTESQKSEQNDDEIEIDQLRKLAGIGQ